MRPLFDTLLRNGSRTRSTQAFLLPDPLRNCKVLSYFSSTLLFRIVPRSMSKIISEQRIRAGGQKCQYIFIRSELGSVR